MMNDLANGIVKLLDASLPPEVQRPSTGHAASTEKELFLEPRVQAALEKYCADHNWELVSALQIIKVHRKFARDPAKRILVVTKTETGHGIKVEMHSFRRETEEEMNTLAMFMKKPAPRRLEESSEDVDDAIYSVIRTYPLVQLKDVKVQEGMFVLCFDDKTPDLCISNLNSNQVKSFIDEAIKCCNEAGRHGTEHHVSSSSTSMPCNGNQQEVFADDGMHASRPAVATEKEVTAHGADDFNSTKTVMEKNKQTLMENQEKLQELGDQTEDMANQAANFLEAVQNMRQHHERKKKWYEL